MRDRPSYSFAPALNTMSETSGEVDFVVAGETFKTWYKVVGDLKSRFRPLVIVHGGPGFPHFNMLGHDKLYKSHLIPIVWYDQLGCGLSSHLPDKAKEFWTPELFMDELENLVKQLGITNNFDVLGHSWGGMLAAQWAAARHPAGMKRLIIADSPASMTLWEKAAAQLLLQMPYDVQETINKHQKSGTFSDPGSQAAMSQYYAKFVCRLQPLPPLTAQSFQEMEKDPTVYNTM